MAVPVADSILLLITLVRTLNYVDKSVDNYLFLLHLLSLTQLTSRPLRVYNTIPAQKILREKFAGRDAPIQFFINFKDYILLINIIAIVRVVGSSGWIGKGEC